MHNTTTFILLTDLNAARALSKKVEDAMAMLEAYNKRLSEEMEARKMVARMLHDYITYQKDLLAQAEETLEVSFISIVPTDSLTVPAFSCTYK